MKKIRKKFVVLLLFFSFVVGGCFGRVNDAKAAIKTNVVYYGCRFHGYGCMHVKLAAKFNSKRCVDVYWAGSNTHWPNAIDFGTTKVYTTYARGTYTIYSSLITQWTSLSFASITDTMYIYN